MKILNPIAILADAVGSVVDRAVVYHQNLHLLRREILCQNAVDGFLDEVAAVVGIDEDGDSNWSFLAQSCQTSSYLALQRIRHPDSQRRAALFGSPQGMRDPIFDRALGGSL